MNKINVLLIIIIITFLFLIFHSYLEKVYMYENFYSSFPDGSPEDHIDDQDLNNFGYDDDDDLEDEDEEDDDNFENMNNNFLNEMLSQIVGFDIFERFVSKPGYRGTSHGGRADCPFGCRSRSRRRRKRASRSRKESRQARRGQYDHGYLNYVDQLKAYNIYISPAEVEKRKKRAEELADMKTSFNNAQKANESDLMNPLRDYSRLNLHPNHFSLIAQRAGDKFNLKINGREVGLPNRYPYFGSHSNPGMNYSALRYYYPSDSKRNTASYDTTGSASKYVAAEKQNRITEQNTSTKSNKYNEVLRKANYDLGDVYSKSIGNIKAESGARPEIRDRYGRITQSAKAPQSEIDTVMSNKYFKNQLPPNSWINNYSTKVTNSNNYINNTKATRTSELVKEQERLTQIQRANDIKAYNDSTKLSNQEIQDTANLRKLQVKLFKELQNKLKMRQQQFSKLRNEETQKMNKHFYDVKSRNSTVYNNSDKTKAYNKWFNDQTLDAHNVTKTLALDAVESTEKIVNNFDSAETDNIKSLGLNIRSNL